MRGSSGRPRPRLGQHFLTNVSIAEKILDALGAVEGDTVVEVGPGRGALTRPLLDRGVRVVGFELDRELAAALTAELSERAFFLTQGDVLGADVEGAVRDAGVEPPVPLVGNLPYESATAILRAFARRPGLFSRMVVMIQREVADRLLAEPGGREYGFLTLDVIAHARTRRVLDVGPGAFTPRPRVFSTVVEITPRAPSPDAPAALRVASAGFSLRRKTLVNALTPLWGRDCAVRAVATAGLPSDVRAETLGLSEFRVLAPLLGPGGLR